MMNRSLNRSFRAPEKREIGNGNLKTKDNYKDEDLALFREMRKREKERNELLLFQNSEEFDSPIGNVTSGNSQQAYGLKTATSAPIPRKSGADEFLNSENDKNDYDWLLTPPGTPLFPSLEMESRKTVMSQLGTPKARPTAVKSLLGNTQHDSTARSNFSARSSNSSAGLNTSTGSLRRPTSSSAPNSRPVTPTGRPTISSSSRSSLPSSNRPTSTSTRPSSSTSSKLTPNTTSRPSRSSTPTSRATLTSAKSIGAPRSSTPTSRSSSRSSTPTNRPTLSAPKPTSRASTPTRRPSTMSSTTIVVKSPNSSLNMRSVSTTTAKPVQPRSSSPSLRPKLMPSEMPDFSLDAPPNLRTSVSDRPPSATRGRPGAPSSRSSSVEPAPNGRTRRQSCSPARGRAPNGVLHNSGSSVPISAANRLRAKANDNTSPGLYGTKMVERVINMRKLMPPKQDDKHSPHSNISGKSSSPDSSGFGRNLSKKSLDMAIRHMDIRRAMPGNLRPLMTNIPASSMYSVRSGPARSKTVSISDSPLATSSSSEVSVNNNALCVDGPELDDDVSSHKCIRSPATLRGR